MTNSVIFKLEKEFEIGDLKLKAYQWRHITLFDPKYLIELVGKVFEKNERTNKQRVLEQLLPESLLTVNVSERKGQVIEKKLLTPQGVYEILFFINTPESRRIRSTFVNLLESFRIEKGLSIDKFLKSAYDKTIVPLGMGFDARYKFSVPEIKLPFSLIDYNDLFIPELCEFPVVDDVVIFDEESEYYLENLDKVKIGFKLFFFVGCEKTISCISLLAEKDKVTVLENLIKEKVKAYNIDSAQFSTKIEESESDGMYFNGYELFQIFNNNEEEVQLFKKLLKTMYGDDIVVNILFNSITKYHHANKTVPPLKFEKYIENKFNYCDC